MAAAFDFIGSAANRSPGGRRRAPPTQRARAFTLLELLIVVLIVALLVATVLPVLAHAGWEARKTRCGKNLAVASRGLGQYADVHRGAFPTCGFGPRTKRFDMIGWRVTRKVNVAYSNSRNLFLAVRLKFVEPAKLICPNTEDVPAALGAGKTVYYDFNVGNGTAYTNRLSYSYHLQFRDRDRSSPGYPLTRDSHGSMALLADRTPCLTYSGARYGSGTCAQTHGIPPDLPACEANSFNHERQGQNVAYVAGHVKWVTVPTAGAEGDNIYTVWNGEDRRGGSFALDSMPRGPTDSFLVP